jgi:hypothetical protein
MFFIGLHQSITAAKFKPISMGESQVICHSMDIYCKVCTAISPVEYQPNHQTFPHCKFVVL